MLKRFFCLSCLQPNNWIWQVLGKLQFQFSLVETQKTKLIFLGLLKIKNCIKNYFTSLLFFSVLDLGCNLTKYLSTYLLYFLDWFSGKLSFLISHGKETNLFKKKILSLNWQFKEGKYCMEDIIWGNTS